MASNSHVESVLAAFPNEKASDAAAAYISKISHATTSESLKELNDHFLPIVYFRGNEFSVDDLHLLVALHPHLTVFNEADRVIATNVTRWFDHIQNISGVSAKLSLPKVDINLNASAVIAAAKKTKPRVPGPAPAQKEEKKEEAKATPPPAEAKKAEAKKSKEELQKEKQEQIMKAKQERAQAAKEKAAQLPKQERAPKAPKPQGEQKQQQPQGGKKGGAADADERSDIEHLDVRVGKILNVKRHPDADALYVEEIDLGEAKPRTIVSGLVKFVPIEELQDRVVVVLANLKPRPLKGIASHGMVLCVSNEDKSKVEPLIVPEGVPVGERVFFGDKPSPHAADAELNPKKKYFEKVQPEWRTNDERVALYKDLVWNSSKGPITTASITKGTIS